MYGFILLLNFLFLENLNFFYFPINNFNFSIFIKNKSFLSSNNCLGYTEYHKITYGYVSIRKGKFSYFNSFFFYKTFKKLLSMLTNILRQGFFFFVFSEHNIMFTFYNLLKYSSNFKFHCEYNFMFKFHKKHVNYYYLHSILHLLHYNYKVNTLILVDGRFTKYNLHAFRNTCFILIGVVDLNTFIPAYDFCYFINNVSLPAIYNLCNTFISLYFSIFFELK